MKEQAQRESQPFSLGSKLKQSILSMIKKPLEIETQSPRHPNHQIKSFTAMKDPHYRISQDDLDIESLEGATRANYQLGVSLEVEN